MKAVPFYFLFLILLLTMTKENVHAQPGQEPLRLAVAGITHGHVPWILGRKDKGDVVLVGVYEKDAALSKKYAAQFGLDTALFFPDLNRMLEAVKPEAVVAFGSTYEHLAVVEACAPKGIHVMVEKPLAATFAQAEKMESLARQHNIHLLTNYETSWYATTEKTYQLVRDSNHVGRLTKAVFHHGHQGPQKIGVNKEFLAWLTDPVQNGGGALMDFGCYGANIMTYLMQGVEPQSVTAITQQFQPSLYPKVDDEATIILTYPQSQAIIQASWNWPFNRKDMEVYGDSGYVITRDDTRMRVGGKGKERQLTIQADDMGVYQDPFTYFAKVVRGKIKVAPHSLYGLSNNVTVVRILEAALQSAKTGKRVELHSVK
jgi:predicted dehydrogenase